MRGVLEYAYLPLFGWSGEPLCPLCCAQMLLHSDSPAQVLLF